MQSGKMSLRVGWTNTEIAFGLNAQHARRQKLAGAEKYMFFKSFNVDLEEVSSRDDALLEKCIETANRYVASLLLRRSTVSIFAAWIHGAGGRI